jgi:predicted DsbA family dithiol-disulfide isomerase
MALKITMFSDFVCPFCYIGFETLRRLESEFDFMLEWRGFEIHPEWPAEGISTERVRAGADAKALGAAWQRIKALADEIGLAMDPPSVLTNSHRALEAAEFAHQEGRGEEFEQRVYRAYFNEGTNIGDPRKIRALAAEVGIDAAKLDEALESGKYSLRLKNNALVANQRGVSGVPTFFIGGFPLVGAQSLDAMRHIVKRVSERAASES